ncbi:MAG: TAXI family TRAP transporter solute-binding subunit, partial [Clostridiales bacterium]|nr:TAXI family TRAP transporter solute-binding subunit [Clostridiales bacterium]
TLIFAFTACKDAVTVGQTQELEEPYVPLAAVAPSPVLRLTMSTGSVSGNYYSFGAALAKAVDEASVDLVIDVLESADAVENIGDLATGRSQLALIPGDILSHAFYATDTRQDKLPITNMAPLMTLYPEICQIVVSASSGLESVADLKERRVAIGEDGSSLRASAVKILEANGLTTEDIEVFPLGFTEAAQAMREKTIDAFFITAGTPNKAMMDLQADRDIVLLGLEEDTIAALTKKYPFYTRYTMDETDYSFLAEPVNTVAVKVTLVAAASLSGQAAYDTVKTIIENSDKIAVTHAKGMYIAAEDAVCGLPLPLHEGALRYFREIGALPVPQPEDAEQEDTVE